MGIAMAGRLVAAGHEVTVWNRSPEAADELVAAGATRAASAAEALAAPISFSMLANDAAAESVLSADNLAGEAGRIHVNMASISGPAADRVAAVAESVGVRYIASPVLGRPLVAAAGNLNILTAGPDAAITEVLPLLEILGARVWRFGEQPRRANAEGVTLVEAHDIDASDFVELLSGTLFAGVVYSGYGPMIAEKRYSPAGFAMPLGLKDLGLAEALAAEGDISLPTAPVLRDRFEKALADSELADLDWSAVAEITRRQD